MVPVYNSVHCCIDTCIPKSFFKRSDSLLYKLNSFRIMVMIELNTGFLQFV